MSFRQQNGHNVFISKLASVVCCLGYKITLLSVKCICFKHIVSTKTLNIFEYFFHTFSEINFEEKFFQCHFLLCFGEVCNCNQNKISRNIFYTFCKKIFKLPLRYWSNKDFVTKKCDDGKRGGKNY